MALGPPGRENGMSKCHKREQRSCFNYSTAQSRSYQWDHTTRPQDGNQILSHLSSLSCSSPPGPKSSILPAADTSLTLVLLCEDEGGGAKALGVAGDFCWPCAVIWASLPPPSVLLSLLSPSESCFPSQSHPAARFLVHKWEGCQK